MTKSIAIITARGGSKRIPGKNLRPFLGKPILLYSIQAAIESGLFSEIMVSTDSTEIAQLATSAGAAVPFMRSVKMSDDYATTADVLSEVLSMYKQRLNNIYDFACCIYPTAPFITGSKLAEAFELIKSVDADVVLPVCMYSSSIWRGYKMKDRKLELIWAEHANTRSQDLEPAYFDCGQFYFFNAHRFIETGKLITNKAYGIEIPETENQDIDTVEDWKMAELKYLYTFHKEKIESLIK